MLQPSCHFVSCIPQVFRYPTECVYERMYLPPDIFRASGVAMNKLLSSISKLLCPLSMLIPHSNSCTLLPLQTAQLHPSISLLVHPLLCPQYLVLINLFSFSPSIHSTGHKHLSVILLTTYNTSSSMQS